MRNRIRLAILILAIAAFSRSSMAQQPSTLPAGGSSTVVDRMMAFDKNGDGRLTRDELTDARLQDLFDRADANKDGFVTKEELMALSAAIESEFADTGGPGGRGRGPGGFPGGGGPGSRGGGPRRGGPPQPGVLIPPPMRDALELSDEQTKQLDALQAEVDEKLEKIFTEAQKARLQEMRGRGFGRGMGPPPGF